MKKLNVKIFRDLIKMKLHTVAIILTLACGVGVYSGVDMAIKSLFYTRDKILHDMKLAHLEIQLLPEDVHNLPDFSDIPEIKYVERRLLLPGVVNLNNKKVKALMIFQEKNNAKINQIQIINGSNRNSKIVSESVGERTLQSYYGVKQGDNINVKVGNKIYENKITGIAVSPEFITISANPEMLLPEKGSLGVFFTSLERIDEVLGFSMVNDIVFYFNENVNHKQVEIKILNKFKKMNLERVIPYEDNFAYKYLQLDLNAFAMYVPAIIVVLGALTFIITLITFNRLIQHQRKEIGAILAIGYNKKQIIRSYAIGAFLICIGGLIVGFPLSLLLRNAVSSIYGNSLGMIYIYNYIFPISLIKGLIFAVLTIGLSFYIPLNNLLKLSPREIIHPEIKDNFLNNFFVKWVYEKISLLPIGYKMGIRNIFRNPIRSSSIILSIALSIGVSISYMISMTSNQETIKMRFSKNNWDIAADFLYPVFYEDYEAIKNIPGVKQIEPYFVHYIEIGKNNHFEGSALMAILKDSKMKYIPLIEGRRFNNPDEIVLSYDLAKKLKVKIGDKVDVKIGMKKFIFSIAGIKSDAIAGESLIDFYKAREMLEFSDEASGIFLQIDNGKANQIEDALFKKEFVAKVTFKEKIVEKFLQITDEMTGIVDIATGISVFVAILFIFSSINMGITEREGEYATFKAIGFNRNKIKAILFSEAVGIGIISAVLSIPIAMGISLYINNLMTDAWYKIFTHYQAKDFLKGIIPMIFLIPISVISSIKYLNKMDIIQAIKTKTIE